MPFNNVRNYFHEKLVRIKNEWKLFQQSSSDPETTQHATSDSDIKRHYHGARSKLTEAQQLAALEATYNRQKDTFINRDTQRNEAFEFFSYSPPKPVPFERSPSPGIHSVPYRYHKGQTVTTTDTLPETGFRIHHLLQHLITHKYPMYQKHIDTYCRPLGTTDATFSDFNREQVPSAPIPEDRKQAILRHCHRFLATKPYLPVHFVDTQYAKLPLSTGTGYYNRHHYKTKAHAHYSRPSEYADKPTSKGYYINAFLENSRTIVHTIKQTGVPFTNDPSSPYDADDLAHHLNKFINEHPTVLYTRNHISDRNGILKQRPVYAADDLFLLIEVMLTFPLLVQARKPQCCIMYGLETIRGANHYLDHVAKSYRSYFSIDWSQFDQRLPRVVTDIFYTDFLRSLIVINQGYQPTYEYPTYPDLDETKLFNRMDNLLTFLHLWFNNMTYLSSDGYAYRRTHAGVPSGIFNTQYLDSFGNIFIIVDALYEFGTTDDEIEAFLLFIMGDDNCAFTHWSIVRLDNFVTFLEGYALRRYNMVLSKTKSIVTSLRHKIETLGYTCNFGTPTRPLGKLIAQLCYPEHGPTDKYMSARAIGIAYAAAAMDLTFHNFCRDVYYTFLPFASPVNEDTMANVIKFLPGQFKMLDSWTELLQFDHFPSFYEVQATYASYKGPLSFAPKWNHAHFKFDPDTTLPGSKTMLEYQLENGLPTYVPEILDPNRPPHELPLPASP